ncbi:MAG: Holliday junction resolvase-like protein [Anaerolineales bacterium]
MANDSQVLLVPVLVAAALLILGVIALWQRDLRRLHSRIEQLIEGHAADLDDARKDSVDRSRSSLKGKIAEQIAPLLPGFPYLPADARFLGDPIDYVVFRGRSDPAGNGALGNLVDIILLEVKIGQTALSSVQRTIARSVEEGRIRFEVCRVLHDGSLSVESWRPRRKTQAEWPA